MNKIIAISILFVIFLVGIYIAKDDVLVGGTTLTVPRGGTGATSFDAGECLMGAGTGAITTGACGGGTYTAFGTDFFTYFSGTTTDALPQGSTNKYWSQTLWDNAMTATTSLPTITTLSSLYLYPSFTYATSTAYTGTSTIPLGVAMTAETWVSAQCFTDAGTLGISFNDGTNRFNYIPTASTTANAFVFTTNNTFTAGEKRYVDIGNPATSPTKISCTIKKYAR